MHTKFSTSASVLKERKKKKIKALRLEFIHNYDELLSWGKILPMMPLNLLESCHGGGSCRGQCCPIPER